MRFTVVLCGLVTWVVSLYADDRDWQQEFQNFRKNATPIVPTEGRLHMLNDSLRLSLENSLRLENLRYRMSAFNHRREAFSWQLASSKIIFYVVITIVLTGLTFSGIQFCVAYGLGKAVRSRDGEQERGGVLLDTEFEASLQSIKVRSPIIGVIILVISLGFFYLYIVHIYRIEEVGAHPDKARSGEDIGSISPTTR